MSIALLCLGPAFGWQDGAGRRFEVASVKPRQEGEPRIPITISGFRWSAAAQFTANLIAYAYGVKPYQVADTSALRPLRNNMFSISAAAGGSRAPSTAEFQEMLRNLLADRFHLVAHREMQDTPVYALVAGKNGPKLHAAQGDEETKVRYTESGRNWEATLTNGTVEDIVKIIAISILDRPVIDATGLTGHYDLKLLFTPQTPPNKRTPDPDDILISEAVEVQLGLRLEPRKAPVETIVVDHIETPSAN